MENPERNYEGIKKMLYFIWYLFLWVFTLTCFLQAGQVFMNSIFQKPI